MKLKEDAFNIIRKIGKNPNLSQRKVSKELDMSLGKINYVLKELKKKGLIKIKNFKKNKAKKNYIYILTPKGLIYKTRTALAFMERKMQEYDELSSEIKKNKK